MRKSMGRRGSYLVMALFFTVVAVTASLILLQLMPSEAASLRVVRRDVEANQACEAGVRDWIAFISHALKASSEPLSTPSETRTGSLGKWSWSAVATADPQTPPHPKAGLRMYKVESTALWDGVPKRKVTAWLQAGVNFTKYAAFTGHSPPVLTATFEGVKHQTTVEGAFRTNGRLVLRFPGLYWTGLYSKPTFTGLVSAAGVAPTADGIEYELPYGGPPTVAGYDRMSSLGKSGFDIGAAPMSFPSGPEPFAESGWGGAPPAPPPAGVSVNPAGGIFVSGSVDKMELGVDVGGNSFVSIVQGGTTTKVTRVTDTPVGPVPVGNRAVQVGNLTNSVAGLGSGVVYSTGDILELSGTNKQATTIAVDFSANHNIVISGNLLRADTALGSTPTSTRDPLGLVAAQVQITDNTSLVPRSPASLLTLYANMFSTDKFYVRQFANPALGAGRLQIFGTMVSNNAWNTGTSAGVVPIGVSGFSHPSGMGSFRLVSDPNANFFPPPVFPASETGQVEIRFWKEVPQ